MNGKKAKKLRKKVYGDLSLSSEEVRSQLRVKARTINTGLRKDYQEMKKNA